MDLDRIRESFTWKKDKVYCAKRLGISIKKYSHLKKVVRLKDRLGDSEQHHNLENNESRISGISKNEPKSADEIIKLLNIDTTKWKLSQYWNKQMSDHWRISALITKIKETDSDYLKNLLDKWKPKQYIIPKSSKTKGYTLSPDRDQVCGVMSLQDIHFGKEGNETVDKDFEDAVKNLIQRAVNSHNIEELFFVVGGDLINMDTFHGTTTKGTPLDNCSTATEAYIQAFNAMIWAITFILSYVKHLTVVYVPGNHDRLSSFHLVHALSKAIDSDQITWDIEYEERKVHVWHNNFNAFEHGDAVSKNTPIVYATEFPIKWGSTKNRTLFTGHFHQNKKIEYMTNSETAGFIHKTLPSLSKTDYYHYHKKYVGNRRSGKLELQSSSKGNICELTYLAD
tara:strand:- start:16507 stop:17694 length:1188 start_codon:yes stop_codon:yes gene_type:complete